MVRRMGRRGKGKGMNRLTLSEAIDMIDHMEGVGEQQNASIYEGIIFDAGVSDAIESVGQFLAGLNREIDPDSITVTSDRVEGMDIPCSTVTIKLGGTT